MDYSYLTSSVQSAAATASDSIYSTTASNYAAVGGIFGALAGMAMIMTIAGIIVWVLTIIANWKIFTKAGEEGWKSIIPIYNMVVLFRVAGISPWWVLGYLAAIIPGIGALVCAGITIYAMIKLAQAFGKSTGFAVGLILLNTIFVLILGLGSSEYQLDKTSNV